MIQLYALSCITDLNTHMITDWHIIRNIELEIS